MIRFLLILYALTTTVLINGQTRKGEDSNFQKWKNENMSLDERTAAYNNFIERNYLYSKPDSVAFHTKKLMNFSIKENFNLGVARAHVLNGNSKLVQSFFPEARFEYEKAIETYKQIDDLRGLGICYANMGSTYNYQSNHPKALIFYLKALKIFQKDDFNLGIAGTSNNIGILYQLFFDYDNALKYYKIAETIHSKDNDLKGLVIVYTNMAGIYDEQDKDSIAQEYYQNSINLSNKISYKSGLAIAKSGLGSYYKKRNNIELALSNYKSSIVLNREIGDNYGLAQTLSFIGLVYTYENKPDRALKYCEEAISIIDDYESIRERLDIYWCLYESFKLKNNATKSLYYHELYLVTSDSLKKQETTKKLQRMEFEKEVLADSLQQVEKGLKVEMLHQTEINEKKRNTSIALAGGFFFLLLSGGLYSRWNYVKKSKAIIEKEKDRSDNLLLNILPFEIAEELKAKGSADARDFDLVSILFTDFKGFTEASEKLTAKELIGEINVCFKAFDLICEVYKIEKIKTIGDAFMAAGGLPVPFDDSVKNTVLAALEMQEFINTRLEEKELINETAFKMRVGIHTGPVVAGIVGVKKFQYDVWGDTVNTASRMESSGETGKVNVSEVTYNLLKNDTDFIFESRGKIRAKGKGEIEMYFISKS
ncbi:adenylate/guanylate cyclase domain-containing protein [Winogradskyella sp. UBA3174]|uniref:adenylate/guanylate cyclase domain-containing protein n=1 Tax=Winogradskyella sp. UBA3174 TaxID=1947785 RepID=UPI0025CC7512|nr:adenylate/guanylate cyclase domain-containing protein [Winogradskyella sp. UBA3174]|tara:strand:- start:25198 stop:27153 length:1956 start_codon:yes stop_codon:yes gene_type:complete